MQKIPNNKKRGNKSKMWEKRIYIFFSFFLFFFFSSFCHLRRLVFYQSSPVHPVLESRRGTLNQSINQYILHRSTDTKELEHESQITGQSSLMIISIVLCFCLNVNESSFYFVVFQARFFFFNTLLCSHENHFVTIICKQIERNPPV